MLRRQAISLLLSSALRPAFASQPTLERFLDPNSGAALLLDVRSGRLLASNNSPFVGKSLLPPGSTLKPFTLSALLTSGKLRPDASYLCPERLTLAGRRMDCTHPRLGSALHVDTAIAYSCNNFVAHAAENVAPGELARSLQSRGLGSLTHLTDTSEVPGDIRPALSPEVQKLQALGEDKILITPAELAMAYRSLALHVQPPILTGLEGAVEFGTAQLAGVSWAKLAGKTGSTRLGPQFMAWFAGFLPSRAPELVIVVMIAGHHGGSDAAPIARQILDDWKSR